MRLHILVVLYKTSPGESRTLSSLARAGQEDDRLSGRLTVWDNSPVPYGPAALDSLDFGQLEVVYRSCPENAPLSLVYNTVLTGMDLDCAVILDQDSDLPVDYFSHCRLSLSAQPGVALHLPIVKSHGLVVSPGRLMFFKGKHVKNPQSGLRKARGMLAITSGMVLSRRYLQVPRFDERLNLYGIDTKFMINLADADEGVVVMPVVLDHDTALWSDISADAMLFRAKSLVASWRVVFESRPIASCLASIYARFFMAKLAVKYRDVRFLKS